MSRQASPPHGGSAPTLATVADEAGVSRQTVSNALNSPELLRPDTLARVQAAIERLGYSPNRAARNLRTRASHLVGLRVDPAVEDSANALMDRFVHSLVESTREAGYHVLLFSADGEDAGHRRVRRAAALRGRRRLRGHRHLPRQPARRLARRHAACRSWRSAGPGTSRPPGTRGSTWTAGPGVVQAVDHLVERGHSRIAWVGWQKGSFIGEDRRSGWVDRMHAHGLSTSRLSARGDDTLEFGARAAHALLDVAGGERPTAFVCASDTVAMGVLRTLDELGLRAGRDVAVVGFDDSIAAQVCTPALTSVRQPLEQVAVEVVRYLGELLAHRPIPELGCVLTPTLTASGETQLVAPPPQVDGVVDLGARRGPAEHLVGDLARRTRCGRQASSSARVANRQTTSSGAALPAVRATRTAPPRPASTHRVAAPEPRPERAARRVVVDDEGRAAAAHHPVELAQARLAARSEEVRPPRLHDVDASPAAAGPAAPYRAAP